MGNSATALVRPARFPLRAAVAMNSALDEALAHALDNISQGIALYDVHGVLVYGNKWVAHALRLPNGSALHERLKEFVASIERLNPGIPAGANPLALGGGNLDVKSRQA